MDARREVAGAKAVIAVVQAQLVRTQTGTDNSHALFGL